MLTKENFPDKNFNKSQSQKSTTKFTNLTERNENYNRSLARTRLMEKV